jgi:capsular exopolysaccharide synthesis family protein
VPFKLWNIEVVMNSFTPLDDWRGDAGQAPSEARGFSVQSILRVFARRWPIIGGVAFLALAIGVGIFAMQAPRYAATAAILIDPKTPGAIGPGTDFGLAVAVDAAKIGSIASVIQSGPLLERVVKSEKLYDDPEFGSVGRGFLGRLLAKLPGHPSSDREDPVDAAVDRLRSATSVTRQGVTYVIEITVNSSNPVKAAHLAQAIGETYLNDQLQNKHDAAYRASSWLSERLEEMRKELIRSEEAVSEIRQAYGLTATDGSGASTVASQQITELNAAIGAAETELSRKQAKVEQARRVQQSGGNVEGLPEVMASSVITSLRAQQSEVLRKLAEMQPLPSQGGFASPRPDAIRMEEARRAIDGQISAEVSRIIANLENDYATSRNNVIALKEQLKALTGGTGANADGQAKLREAQSVADANRQVYAASLNKLKELEQSQTMQDPEARMFENARVPDKPSFPRLPIFVGASLGLGLLLGAGGAFAAEHFSPDRMQSSAFITPVEVEQTLRLPMLASVPLLTADDSRQEGSDLDVLQYLVANQFSHFAESLRGIRFGLRRTDDDATAKVIQITSTVPGEGKSTLAASLAMSSASSGARVILIDCDFRRPMTSKLFHLTHAKGVSDLLTGRAEWHEIANIHYRSSLTVVPVGGHGKSSLDLIASPRMNEVLKFASEHYDLVFLDSAPVLPVSDAAVISSMSDKTILLIEWNKTDRDLVRKAIDSINLNKGNIIGVVLNKVNLSAVKSYGPDYSKYFTDAAKYYERDHA